MLCLKWVSYLISKHQSSKFWVNKCIAVLNLIIYVNYKLCIYQTFRLSSCDLLCNPSLCILYFNKIFAYSILPTYCLCLLCFLYS